jgi:hypothetical protein
MKYYLGIAMMFRDEACWLKEFIEYHRLIGVEKFYLFDHLSTDHPELVLADYIRSGVVSLERREDDVGGNFMQLAVDIYNKALKLARGECRWLAMLDSDEFIVPKTTTSLPRLLEEYEAYGGLTVNWQMFGTGGVAEIPPDVPMVQALQKRGLCHLSHCVHIKSIVQPKRVDRTVLHFAFYTGNYYAVNTNHKRIDGPFDHEVTVDKVQLNHYFSRDLKFLHEVKIPRRKGLGMSAEDMVQWDNDMAVEDDDCIMPFIEPLKARLGFPQKFDWVVYLKRYPELAEKGVIDRKGAFQHWMDYGKFEGRICV